jgi:glycine oxidase
MIGDLVVAIAIVGNGIIGYACAVRLLSSHGNNLELTIFGQRQRDGSASTAAAAMLNSFAEVDAWTLNSPASFEHLRLSQLARHMWPEFLELCGMNVSSTLKYGTVVVKNARTDALEDENFAAIRDALSLWNEPHSMLRESEIVGLKPNSLSRPTGALFIEGEGFMDPQLVLKHLDVRFDNDPRVHRNFQPARRVYPATRMFPESGASVELESGQVHSFDYVIVSAGSRAQELLPNLWHDGLPTILHGSGVTLRLNHSAPREQCVIRTPNRGLACGIYTAPYGEEIIVGATSAVGVTFRKASLENIRTISESVIDEINRDLVHAPVNAIQSGSRPVSSDGEPIVDAIAPTIAVVSGTKRDGWHLAPLISKAVSDWTLGAPNLGLELFNADNRPYRQLNRVDAVNRGARELVNAMHQHGYREPRGGYREAVEENYRRYIDSLHDRLGLMETGIPIDLLGVASKAPEFVSKLLSDSHKSFVAKASLPIDS